MPSPTFLVGCDSADEKNIVLGDENRRRNSHRVGPSEEEAVSLMNNSVADAEVVRRQRTLMGDDQKLATPSGVKQKR